MNRMRTIVLLVGVIAAVGPHEQFCGAAEPAAPATRQRRILYNNDGSSPMFLKKGTYKPGPVSEQDLRAIVDELTQPGSQVDTLILNVNAQITFYPSKVGTMIGSLLTPEERKNPKIFYQEILNQLIGNLESFFSRGVDPYALILARAKEQPGLEALISFRMNDAHEGGVESPNRCKLWLDHPEYRLDGGYSRGFGLDFGYEEVREYTYRVIEEAVQRYDCDGIELDFNRFPTFFKEGEGGSAKHVAAINQLVQRVRQLTIEEGKKRNKHLILAVRVPTSYDYCLQNGLDPVEWANQGWIDFLTVSEFLFVRYDLPIAPWKKLIKNIPVYGSIECAEGNPFESCLTPDKYRRAARHLWADGADGVYLFNFFTTREWKEQGFEPPFEVLTELGDPTKLPAPE